MEYDRMKEVKEFDDSKIGVKGLVDSGVTTIPRIFVHPPENLHGLKSTKMSEGIPIIDLAGMNSNRQLEIIHHIQEAARTWGFFQVINHDVPQSALDATISAIKSFHEQEQEIKKMHYIRDQPVSYVTNIDLYRSKAANWGDALLVSMAPDPPVFDRIPSICREEILAWDEHVRGLGERLTELLCMGLGLEPGRLKELQGLVARSFVGHYYPYCPQPDRTMGIPSHRDPGVLTVLLQDQIGGLQVKQDEDWVDVKPLPGALVINIGDFFQIISNDEYKSGVHRVVANPFREPRISIAVFINAGKKDDSDYYGPLEDLVSLEKPALYRNFKLSEFVEKFHNKEIADQSLIDKFRL